MAKQYVLIDSNGNREVKMEDIIVLIPKYGLAYLAPNNLFYTCSEITKAFQLIKAPSFEILTFNSRVNGYFPIFFEPPRQITQLSFKEDSASYVIESTVYVLYLKNGKQLFMKVESMAEGYRFADAEGLPSSSYLFLVYDPSSLAYYFHHPTQGVEFPNGMGIAATPLAEGMGYGEKIVKLVLEEGLELVRLKGSLTNNLYQMKLPGVKSHVVLLRTYKKGIELFFPREDEIRVYEYMAKLGMGPNLLFRFPSGRMEQLINSKTLSPADLRNPVISSLIAFELRKFHQLDMKGPKTVKLWDRLRAWLRTAKQLCSLEEADEFYLIGLEEHICLLEKRLTGDDRVGFCHNDLQYGNLMLNESTNTITIIDYEYATYNPIAFDIANHFCEMAADYHAETPHLLDYSEYPDLEERIKFVRCYLGGSGRQSVDYEAKLIEDIELYALASHLMWGFWGIILWKIEGNDYFNYEYYGKQRIEWFLQTWPELMGHF